MSEGSASRPEKKIPAKAHRQTGGPLDRQRSSEELKRFLDLALREMNLAAKYEISAAAGSRSGQEDADPSREAANQGAGEDTDIVVRFSGADEDLLLSRNGELLLALEYLAHRWLRLEPALHDRVRFDCGDYRATRLEELKLSARVAAQRVRETGQPFQFNPMSSRDRRIIHLELNGAAGVRTMSEGSGDRRHLIIYPVTKK
jgi:spoIIIJ-associated protein